MTPATHDPLEEAVEIPPMEHDPKIVEALAKALNPLTDANDDELMAASEVLTALTASGYTIRKDDPDWDATDFALPAWWRGEKHGAAVICKAVTEILDGKDTGGGTNNEPWATVRKRLLALSPKDPTHGT